MALARVGAGDIGNGSNGPPAPAPLPFLGLFNRKLRQKALMGSNTLICNRVTNVLSPQLKIRAMIADVVFSRLT